MFFQYQEAKANWRKHMHKPTRRVRKFAKRSGKGKGGGKGWSRFSFLAEMPDGEYDEFFYGGKGTSKGKPRSFAKGKGRRTNPKGRDGQTMKCSQRLPDGSVCGSETHFRAQCPHNPDKGAGKGSNRFAGYGIGSGPISTIGMVIASTDAAHEPQTAAPQAGEDQMPIINRLNEDRFGPYGQPAWGNFQPTTATENAGGSSGSIEQTYAAQWLPHLHHEHPPTAAAGSGDVPTAGMSWNRGSGAVPPPAINRPGPVIGSDLGDLGALLSWRTAVVDRTLHESEPRIEARFGTATARR